MLAISSTYPRTGSMAQFVTIVALFILIVVLAFFSSKLISSYAGRTRSRLGNIEVVEALRISQTQVVEIIRFGERFVAVAVSKDCVERLGEWSKEDLALVSEEDPDPTVRNKNKFSSILLSLEKYAGKDEEKS